MHFTRRGFLIGAGSGLSLLALTACTDPQPVPTATVRPPSTPPTTPQAVPKPAGMSRSAWGADPFSRGSVSFMAVGSTPEHRAALREPVLDRVFFAGEATSTEHAGTVLGARQSGATAASAVVAAAGARERIAVVGAGLAGAEAARLLVMYGHTVTVIEARDRVGGRVHTIDSPNWPSPVELGAWRLNAVADAAALTDLATLNVPTAPIDGSQWRASGPATTPTGATSERPVARTTTNTVGATAVASAIAWAAKAASDVSLSTALDSSGARAAADSSDTAGFEGSDLLAAQLASVAVTTGADAAELSAWYGSAGSPDDANVAVTGGLSALVSDGLHGITVALSTTVVGVSYSGENVSLRLGTGESITVDRVVVTVPLGVLQSGGIEFTPLLPFGHRTAIDSLGMGRAETLWLRFDSAFWSAEAAVWHLAGTDSAITEWVNMVPITGDPVLVGFVGGEAAEAFSAMSDDEVVAQAMSSLAPFLSA